MEIKVDDMVFEGHIILGKTIEDVEDEPILENVWETNEINVTWTKGFKCKVYRPFMPPHPYSVVLFYWYLIKDSCIMVQGRDGKCWYL